MRSLGRGVLWAIGILLLGVPLSFVSTLALIPLWRWIEATFGIESLGHSGPADWCFELNLCVWVVIGLLIALRLERRRNLRR